MLGRLTLLEWTNADENLTCGNPPQKLIAGINNMNTTRAAIYAWRQTLSSVVQRNET
jgi:hypothetical protein